MQATYKTDDATFNVTFRQGDDEFTGNCSWEISLADIAKIYAETEFHLDHFSDPAAFTEYNSEFDTDLMFHDGSADALIILLAAASQLETPTTFDLTYHGEPYWFFHDTVHAEYDSGDGSEVYIDEDSETRALPMGAERAAEAGAPISGILRELVKAGNEFEDRFGFAFDPVEAFLESVELIVKT
jgi:hypothetical protein